MRTTITLDDDVLESLREATGIRETSALVRKALLEMRQREAARRIAALGGTMPDLKAPPRRRPPRFVNPD